MHHLRDYRSDNAPYDGRQPAGSNDRDSDWLGEALGQITNQIRNKLTEVESRHAQSLAQLEARLDQLSRSSGQTRPQLPDDLAQAFGRLEDGLNSLVHSIADTRSAADPKGSGFVFRARATPSNDFVPLELRQQTPKTVFAEPPRLIEGEWDQAAADALRQIYENGEAGLAVAGKALDGDPDSVRTVSACSDGQPAHADYRPVVVAGLGEDRAWLDGRFSSIADEIGRALEEARPDAAIDALFNRVDSFEAKFNSALESVSTGLSGVAKTSHLRQLEGQVSDLGRQIIHVKQQLEMLGGIEQQLSELNQLAAAAQTAGHDDSGAGPDAFDSAALAESLADRTAERLSHVLEELGSGNGQPDGALLADTVADRTAQRLASVIEAMGQSRQLAVVPSETSEPSEAEQMLTSFIEEQRQAGAVTNGVLDTMQEALVRLIDRVEAIDTAQSELLRTASQFAQQAPEPAPEPAATAFGRRGQGDASSRPARHQAENSEEVRQPRGTTGRLRVETLDENETAQKHDLAGAAQRTAARESEVTGASIRQRMRASIAMQSDAAATHAEAAEESHELGATRRGSPQARETQPASIGRRGLYIAIFALILVGVSYLANLLLADRYGGLLPRSASNPAGIHSDEFKRTPASPSNVRGEAPALPGGGAGGQLRATDQAIEKTTRTGDEVPPMDLRPRSQHELPRNVPETVTDDLSQQMGAQSVAVAAVQPVLRASAPMAGIMLDTSSKPRQLMAPNAPAGAERGQIAANADIQPPAAARNQAGAPVVNRVSAPIATGANPPPGPLSAATSAGNQGRVGQRDVVNDGMGLAAEPRRGGMQGGLELPPAMIGPMSLRIAAAQDNPSAAFEVGVRFAEGRGIKQDFSEAYRWYHRSAAKGFALAQYRLATLYERGLGTTADAEQARLWYTRAAEQGNVKAMHNLAVFHSGREGVAPDYEQAAMWYTAAAERGLMDSQFNLAILYENGLGVPKDARQAYKWYALAARSGDKDAMRRRDALIAALDTAVVRTVESDVASWQRQSTSRLANDARFAGDQWRQQRSGG